MDDSRLADPDFATAGLESGLDADRPTRVRYQVLAWVCCLAVITYIHRVGFATASAEFKASMGLSDTHIGWLMAAFMVAYGLFEMSWGVLCDGFGVRYIMAVLF